MKTNPGAIKSHKSAVKGTAVKDPAADFHGASVIDPAGNEIPITEAMVQQACNRYIQEWELAQKKS